MNECGGLIVIDGHRSESAQDSRGKVTTPAADRAPNQLTAMEADSRWEMRRRWGDVERRDLYAIYAQ